MKIALIIDGLERGGAERQAVVTATSLLRVGHEVVLISYGPKNAFRRQIKREGIHLVEIRDRGLLRLKRIFQIRKVLRAERCDVAYSFKTSTSLFGTLAAKLAGTPCIQSSCRGYYWPGFMPRKVKRKGYPGWYESGRWIEVPAVWLNRWLSRRTAGWTVNSRDMRLFAHLQMAIPRENVSIVYNAVLPDDCISPLSRQQARSKMKLDLAVPVVTIIGSLRPIKNHAMLLRVAELLKEKPCHPIFLVVGEGPLRQTLEAQALSSSLGETVRFLGDRDDIADVLRASDVVVSTSISEGLPNVLIEAITAGIPCVATRSGGSRDIIQNGINGYLVASDDAAEMATKVSHLLEDSMLYERMSTAARQVAAERFSPSALAKRLLSIWTRSLKNKSRDSTANAPVVQL